MLITIIVLSSILGLLIGSFLNVIADRLSQEKGFLKGRSVCDSCGKELKPVHLIPVVSYLCLKGRCGYCKEKMSICYPLSELLPAALFGIAAYFSRFALSPTLLTGLNFGYLIVVFSVFSVILLSDLKYQIIPNQVVYFGIIFVFLVQVGSLGFWAYKLHSALKSDIIGAYMLRGNFYQESVLQEVKSFGMNIGTGLLICLVFYLLVVLTKERGMGGGDVKLGLMLGLFNGFPNGFLALFLAFSSGALVSLALMATAKKGLKDTVPFGPFLVMGSIIAQLFGPQLLGFYLGYHV